MRLFGSMNTRIRLALIWVLSACVLWVVLRIQRACQNARIASRPKVGNGTVAAIAVTYGEQVRQFLLGVVVAWGGSYAHRNEHAKATPTAMGPHEALVTASLAGVKPGSIVYDPFCGGGTLLVAAQHLGAYAVMGTDVNATYLEVLLSTGMCRVL
mmetsp:Transcript_39320/g.111341  ORF Transcript_39320/g.111341 Transcript_39320/m.111341 type:complete len:155 (-) Transcript_39320:1197-1661(-)